MRSTAQLREDALAIWQAGVDAVKSDVLVERSLEVAGDTIRFGEVEWQASPDSRVLVVGAGKAGAGMVLGLERAFGRQGLERFQVTGCVNVPADCVLPTQSIKLHAARPAGINQPTEEGVKGAHKIMGLAASARPQDLVICLISGGGSALLPAPLKEIPLADKRAVTELLSLRGANIEELNTVRIALSQIKGGGLAGCCRSDTLVTLIISDVLGDPLEFIASGPTIDQLPDPLRAVRLLEKFCYGTKQGIPESVREWMYGRRHECNVAFLAAERRYPRVNVPIIIGNNAVAVDAAGMEAERRGYSHAMHASIELEGSVEKVAAHHARMAYRMISQRGPDCLITGGEPIVALPTGMTPGKGGRNQQLALIAGRELSQHSRGEHDALAGICLLAGGTDGEDGPTDAAGGLVDGDVFARARELELDLSDFINRFDAYPFLDATGGLIRSGPTHTNVCDLRVITVARVEPQRGGVSPASSP